MSSVRNLTCIFYTYGTFQFKVATIHVLYNPMTCLCVFLSIYLCLCILVHMFKPQEKWKTYFPFTCVKKNLTLLTEVHLGPLCWTSELYLISLSPLSHSPLSPLKMDLQIGKQTKNWSTHKATFLWRIWHFNLQKRITLNLLFHSFSPFFCYFLSLPPKLLLMTLALL